MIIKWEVFIKKKKKRNKKQFEETDKCSYSVKKKITSRIRKSDMGRILIYSILYHCYYLFLMVIRNNVLNISVLIVIKN